jgi:hypothetical protein
VSNEQRLRDRAALSIKFLKVPTQQNKVAWTLSRRPGTIP